MSTSYSVATWLKNAQARLKSADITTARLDALVLLEDALRTNRAHLLAHPELEISHQQQSILDVQLRRREQHEPLAYIRTKAEFYGREFTVSAHTLVPRPETETLIDLLKSLKIRSGSRLADIGTGSGCIAITAALEIPDIDVDAYEIDAEALGIAMKNAQILHTPHIIFRLNDVLDGVHDHYDIVLANLPYVPDTFEINLAASHEPRHAIFGGSDGLDLYRRLFNQLATNQPSYILTEALPPQHTPLAQIAEEAGFVLSKTDDFIQLFVPHAV